jgi:hypothetical protein
MIAQYLNEKMVAEQYNIGIRQLRLMRMRGDGPVYKKVSGALSKTGGRVLYAVSAIEDWLNACPTGGGRKAE